jgi:hypothetical protein
MCDAVRSLRLTFQRIPHLQDPVKCAWVLTKLVDGIGNLGVKNSTGGRLLRSSAFKEIRKSYMKMDDCSDYH